MSDMKAYLASKYMSGPKADAILARSTDPTIKKRKKKVKNEDYPTASGSGTSGKESSGLMFRDEDDEWKRRTGTGEDMDIDGEDAPVVGKDIATFKTTKSQWNTVAEHTSIPLRSTDIEVKAEPEDPSDTPAAPAEPPKQVTKRKGGLRTAAQMAEAAAAAALANKSPSPGPDDNRPDPTVTVHRDTSGKVLDVEALKAAAKKAEEEDKERERKKEEWGKGLRQREDREERARLEREMASSRVERYADDAGMNREMREVERWNDPAAEFLSKKKKSKGPRRPKYQGGYPTNRFSIPPGFRWDGVDRSNGFEKKLFQYQNAAVRAELEHNQWSMEDM